MPADLKKAFFERDLSENEETLLAEEIAASPEAALTFASHAADAYAATGLPAPKWPRSSPGISWIPKLLLVGTIVSIGAWWAITHWPNNPCPVDVRFQTLPDNSTRSAPRGPMAAPEARQADRAAAPKAVHPPAEQVTPRFVITPGRKYEGLGVIVNQRRAGLVTVRVLDAAGGEVRLIYAGMLDPGEWTFKWDGLLQDGSYAAPGKYTVETQSGKAVLQKKVQIEVE